eukprot:tig00001299_g8069.t1
MSAAGGSAPRCFGGPLDLARKRAQQQQDAAEKRGAKEKRPRPPKRPRLPDPPASDDLLSNLPEELLLHILQYVLFDGEDEDARVNGRALSSISLTCRRFHALAHSARFPLHLCLSPHPDVSAKWLRSLLRKQQLRKQIVSLHADLHRHPIKRFGVAHLLEEAAHCPLERLRIVIPADTDGPLRELTIRTAARRLDLGIAGGRVGGLECPNLEELRLRFGVGYTTWMDGTTLLGWLASCKGTLRELRMESEWSLTFELPSPAQLSAACPNLTAIAYPGSLLRGPLVPPLPPNLDSLEFATLSTSDLGSLPLEELLRAAAPGAPPPFRRLRCSVPSSRVLPIPPGALRCLVELAAHLSDKGFPGVYTAIPHPEIFAALAAGAPCLRRLRLVGPGIVSIEALASFAALPLEALALEKVALSSNRAAQAAAPGRALAEQAAARSLPALRALELRRIIGFGPDDLRALLAPPAPPGPAPFPALRSLTLAGHPLGEPGRTEMLAGLDGAALARAAPRLSALRLQADFGLPWSRAALPGLLEALAALLAARPRLRLRLNGTVLDAWAGGPPAWRARLRARDSNLAKYTA